MWTMDCEGWKKNWWMYGWMERGRCVCLVLSMALYFRTCVIQRGQGGPGRMELPFFFGKNLDYLPFLTYFTSLDKELT